MNRYAVCFFVTAFFTSSACLAQLHVEGSDGNSVTIGPGGIEIHSPQKGTHLNISPGGISGVTGKNKNLLIAPGGVSTSSVSKSSHSVSTSSRSASSLYAVTGKPHAAKPAEGENFKAQVDQIELAVTGTLQQSMPLMARVEKLEVDNLGKKGTGSLKDRIAALAKTLGVNLKPAAQTLAPGTGSIESGSVGGGSTAFGSGTQVNVAPSYGPGGAKVSVAPGFGAAAGAEVNITPGGVSVQSAGPGRALVTTVQGVGASSIVIDSNFKHETYSLSGGTVVIHSNDCNLKLLGHCQELIVNGNHNTVTAERISSIVVHGNSNTVSWSGNLIPEIIDNGNYNSITKK